MNKLVEECKEHNFVYLKSETVPVPEPKLKLVNKTVYVCVDCGTGLDHYDLDDAIVIGYAA